MAPAAVAAAFAVDATDVRQPEPAVLPDVATPSSLFDSQEWNFVERLIARAPIETGSGRCKKIYNDVDARVKVWRILRGIYEQIGVGNVWPQWVALKRDENTGELKSEKTTPVLLQTPPPAPQSGVTEGGMPIRASAPPASEMDEFKRSIAETLANALSSRSEPPRKATPAESVA